MDDISLIESDPSSILFSDNSDLLEELIGDIFDSTFTHLRALGYPVLLHLLPQQLSLYIRPLNLRGAAEITLVSTLEAAPLTIDYKLNKPYSYCSIFQVQTPSHCYCRKDPLRLQVMEEESEQIQAALAALVLNAFDNPSLDHLTNYNSTTSEYMPTYFDYFNTVYDAPSGDPLSSFMNRSPCSSLPSDDDFSYQLDVDNSLDDDDDNDDIFYDAVPDEGDLDVFFDAFETFDDDTTVDANVPFRWAYFTLMSQWMFTLFHRPFNMILFSLTWVIQVVKFLFSAQPFLLASALIWDTLIYYHRPPSFPLLAFRLANLGAI